MHTQVRDLWFRSVCSCVEKLKAAAFDASVERTAKRLDAVGREQGEGARLREATREGVRLLMERFYMEASAVQPAADESVEQRLGELALALSASLLTRQVWR